MRLAREADCCFFPTHTTGFSGSFIEKGAVSVSVVRGVLSKERAAAMSARYAKRDRMPSRRL